MDQKKIGGFLRELRKERGLTQEQLSEILGQNGSREFPIVKDTTPNMMNPRLYTTSYNKP